jgi:hypothetical protein
MWLYFLQFGGERKEKIPIYKDYIHATKGRDLRLEVRRIRSGAFRDRHGDVVWLDITAPHRHLVVDVTVTSARTNTNVPHISAPLPLSGSLAWGAQQAKLDADLRTSALLGTPSV